MTPQVDHKTKKDVDESTRYVMTQRLVGEKCSNNNGKVGNMVLLSRILYSCRNFGNHPASVASSPQHQFLIFGLMISTTMAHF